MLLYMLDKLTQLAIEAALKNQWQKAVALNLKILKIEPKNNEALSRLAKAYFELGNLEKASYYYKKVIKNEPYNQVAKKYLKLIKNKKSKINNNAKRVILDPNFFIEEPGKSKLIDLIDLPSPNKFLDKIKNHEQVKLVSKNGKISVFTFNNLYLGKIPDDLSKHLTQLINNGNTYLSAIKSFSPKQISVFIKEGKTANNKQYTTSFPLETDDFHSLNEDFLTSEPILDLNEN